MASASREPDRTADGRPVGIDVVAQMTGRQHAHREDQHLGSSRRQFGIDGVFHPPVEVVVEEATQVGEAPRLVDDADDGRFFRERDDDMPDVERDRIVGGPDGKDVRSSRFALAADDSADRTGLLVDDMGERLGFAPAPARTESAARPIREQILEDLMKPSSAASALRSTDRLSPVGSWPTAGVGIEPSLENSLQQMHRVEQRRPAAIAGCARCAFGEDPAGDAVDLLVVQTARGASTRTSACRASIPAASQSRMYQSVRCSGSGPPRRRSLVGRNAVVRYPGGKPSSVSASVPGQIGVAELLDQADDAAPASAIAHRPRSSRRWHPCGALTQSLSTRASTSSRTLRAATYASSCRWP